MMFLSIIYMSTLIVIAVCAIAGVTLYKIDKHADRTEDQ
jgi:preprotein translocase subunit SecE